MNAPVIELPRSFRERVECGRRSQKDALQPHGERFDGFGHCTGLGVDFDDMGSIARTIVFGEAGHGALLQLFNPLNLPLEAIADVDSEPGIFGIEDIPLRATLESIGMGFDKIFESVNPSVELAYFSRVVVFPLFDCFE